MALYIERYKAKYAIDWDKFIVESMNGTFLQTRKFIEYHPLERFRDHSLLIFKGNKIVGSVLACEIIENEEKILFSHKGTTFGGIIVSQQIYSATKIAEVMDIFEEYIKKESFDKVYLKQTPAIFQKKNTDLLDYFLYQRGYIQYTELNYHMDLKNYQDDILSQFSASKRRDYRYSLKNELEFRELIEISDIRKYYEVLQLNLKKLELPSVHKVEELIDLKFNRFNEIIKFFGVYKEEKIIAGSMIFLFDNNICHTQYLSSDERYLEYYPMDFLIYNLINYAVKIGSKTFTFGVCTEDQGRYLNLGLSRFKEGFGTEYCLNKSYEHRYKTDEE